MAVHMFRVFVGRGPMSVADLNTRIDDWVASNAEWTGDPTEHTLTASDPAIYETDFYGTDVRFLLDDAKDNLLQKFTDKLKDKVAWYRVGYHRCAHHPTDDPRAECSFDPDDTVEWTATDVTIPSDIPTIPS